MRGTQVSLKKTPVSLKSTPVSLNSTQVSLNSSPVSLTVSSLCWGLFMPRMPLLFCSCLAYASHASHVCLACLACLAGSHIVYTHRFLSSPQSRQECFGNKNRIYVMITLFNRGPCYFRLTETTMRPLLFPLEMPARTDSTKMLFQF